MQEGDEEKKENQIVMIIMISIPVSWNRWLQEEEKEGIVQRDTSWRRRVESMNTGFSG